MAEREAQISRGPLLESGVRREAGRSSWKAASLDAAGHDGRLPGETSPSQLVPLQRAVSVLPARGSPAIRASSAGSTWPRVVAEDFRIQGTQLPGEHRSGHRIASAARPASDTSRIRPRKVPAAQRHALFPVRAFLGSVPFFRSCLDSRPAGEGLTRTSRGLGRSASPILRGQEAYFCSCLGWTTLTVPFPRQMRPCRSKKPSHLFTLSRVVPTRAAI